MSGIRIGRCRRCHTGWHPAPVGCPSCRGSVDEGTVPGTGRVLSWTRVWRPPEGFVAPQRVVLVALDDPEQTGPVHALAAAPEAILETGTLVQVNEGEDGRLVAGPR